MILIGIDPGISGGIAVLYPEGQVKTYKVPETESDIVDFFRQFISSDVKTVIDDVKAIIERVHGLPKMGGSSMFNFGRNYGTIRTALTALKIPFDDVPPKTWQKEFSIFYKKGMTGTQKKNVTKARAQQLYPTIQTTHAIADALLILEYVRRRELKG